MNSVVPDDALNPEVIGSHARATHVALSAIKLFVLAAFMLGISPLLRDRIAAAGVGGWATTPVDLFRTFRQATGVEQHPSG